MKNFEYYDQKIVDEIGKAILRGRRQKHQDLSHIYEMIDDLVRRNVTRAKEEVTHFNQPRLMIDTVVKPWESAQLINAIIVSSTYNGGNNQSAK